MRRTQKNLKLLAFLFAISIPFMSCVDPVQKPANETVDPPEEIISVVQAKEMYESYEDRRIGIIRQFEGPNPDGSAFEPTRYGWYDYETIKQYLAYIEQEAEQAGVEISGLKFYFSNYPDAETFEDGNPIAFRKQNSFFLTPTLSQNGNHVAFLTTGNGEGGRQAILVKDKIREIGKAREQGKLDFLDSKKKYYSAFHPKMLLLNISFQDEGEDRSLILNEANLIPPPPQNTDMDD